MMKSMKKYLIMLCRIVGVIFAGIGIEKVMLNNGFNTGVAFILAVFIFYWAIVAPFAYKSEIMDRFNERKRTLRSFEQTKNRDINYLIDAAQEVDIPEELQSLFNEKIDSIIRQEVYIKEIQKQCDEYIDILCEGLGNEKKHLFS